jgi:hypothetical protein
MSDEITRKPEDSWKAESKEKWIAVQQAIHLSRDLGSFIGTIVGPMAAELGGLLGDQMKAWRAANLDRIARKWEQKRRERNIPAEIIKQLPFRDAIVVLDTSSLEDQDEIQELWARLILNATDVDAHVEIQRMHVDILKSINALEARILLTMFDITEYGDFSQEHVGSRWREMMRQWPKMTSDELRVALLNMQRMGLLTLEMTEMDILKCSTFDEWESSVNKENIVEKFKEAITSVVLSLTDYSGNPMNDVIIPNDPDSQIKLIHSYGLTRIGYDLFEATRRYRERA